MRHIVIALLALLLFGGSSPVGPEIVRLEIRVLPVRSCVDERGLQLRGMALEVGGAQVTHVLQRAKLLDGAWSGWSPVHVPFHEAAGKYDTRVKVVYGSDLEPVEVVSTEDVGGFTTVTLRNVRRSTSLRVYVGDNADFARLDCIVDNALLACNSVMEV